MNYRINASSKGSKYPQDFSLPNPIIKYIIEKPSLPKAYNKLIQTCKYFFATNPIFVVHCIHASENGQWKTCICKNGCQRPHERTQIITFENPVVKLWITHKLAIWIPSPQNLISVLTPKLYIFDIPHVVLHDQIIRYNDFKNLYFSTNFVLFKDVIVKYDDGRMLAFEEVQKTIDVTLFKHKM
uniref:Uncharacterized protein n=1 Tax=Panagrolaimus sp. ES5 TaxID=591445 RepID=A0AC34F9J8_9BILA